MIADRLDGRVPIHIDRSTGDRPVILIVHDIGTVPDLSQFHQRHAVVLPHLRGHGRSAAPAGGTYTLAGYAADTLRALRLADEQWIVAGLGRGALVAAAAAAAEPARVRGLILAPGDAEIPCSTEPLEARARWIKAALDQAPMAPSPRLGWPEPLHPAQRDEIWRDVPRPIGWIEAPDAEWTDGAPVDVVGAATGDAWADIFALADNW